MEHNRLANSDARSESGASIAIKWWLITANAKDERDRRACAITGVRAKLPRIM
jgi:hypothetical protein